MFEIGHGDSDKQGRGVEHKTSGNKPFHVESRWSLNASMEGTIKGCTFAKALARILVICKTGEPTFCCEDSMQLTKGQNISQINPWCRLYMSQISISTSNSLANWREELVKFEQLCNPEFFR